MAVRAFVDRKALSEYLYTNTAAVAQLQATAEAFKDGVDQASPHGRSLSWPGRRPIRHGWFQESLTVRKFRHYWRVEAQDPFAWLVEYGSVNNPPYSPFRRTLRRFGGKEDNPYRSSES